MLIKGSCNMIGVLPSLTKRIQIRSSSLFFSWIFPFIQKTKMIQKLTQEISLINVSCNLTDWQQYQSPNAKKKFLMSLFLMFRLHYKNKLSTHILRLLIKISQQPCLAILILKERVFLSWRSFNKLISQIFLSYRSFKNHAAWLIEACLNRSKQIDYTN